MVRNQSQEARGIRRSEHQTEENGSLIAALIDSFDLDPAYTRQQLRELPELRDPFISDLFALVVFLCDGLLTVGTGSFASSSSANNNNKAARFFRVARCLPMDLQMTLCNHVFGSSKVIVLTKNSNLHSRNWRNCLRARMDTHDNNNNKSCGKE